MGGMKIKTHYRLSKNERLNFKMILGENSIYPKGRVVYSKAPPLASSTLRAGALVERYILAGFRKSLPKKLDVSGIQFLEVSGQDSTLLQQYLSALEGSSK